MASAGMQSAVLWDELDHDKCCACSFIVSSHITPVHAGLRQTNRIRALYLQRALQQEVGFFDVHATTGMMMQGLNEDTLIIQQAIGEKVGVTIHFLATFVGGYAIGEVPATVWPVKNFEMCSYAICWFSSGWPVNRAGCCLKAWISSAVRGCTDTRALSQT